ncbi:hypothetical protein GUJ93_ZPchr0008g11424 [Zizania palustris]|uniref:Myb-like domain-containing protein n=1 Tax=Zizania palustris TaxID=103762 RepID=A0A8J5RCL5_ZIZPA|nr:hypothetical protein GUJ93_ZPchr0008g11424 [Zizania palustris]
MTSIKALVSPSLQPLRLLHRAAGVTPPPPPRRCCRTHAAPVLPPPSVAPVLPLPSAAEAFREALLFPYFGGQPYWLRGAGVEAWTAEENKVFEKALARIDRDALNRWELVAAMLPRKTVLDVVNHYKDLENDNGSIEAGLVPFSHYNSLSTMSAFTLQDWDSSDDGFRRGCYLKRGRTPDQERKKGVPWTEEEHK